MDTLWKNALWQQFGATIDMLDYTMRHVQEHAAELNMFLGQNSIAGVYGWVGRAKADGSGE